MRTCLKHDQEDVNVKMPARHILKLYKSSATPILGPFWIHLGSIWGSFGAHFGSILGSGSASGRLWGSRSCLGPFLTPLCTHLGSILGPILGPIFGPKSDSKTRPVLRPFPKLFWDQFWTHFGAILEPCGAHVELLSTHRKPSKTNGFSMILQSSRCQKT